MKRTDKFKVNLACDENPYEEQSSSWNVFIDVFTSVGVQASPDEVCLDTMMREHGMPLGYYKTYLPILIEDGVLTPLNQSKAKGA